MEEWFSMTAAQLGREIREKRIGVEELVRAFLARIEKYDGPGGLNAIAEIDPSAIRQAKAMDSQKDREALPLFGLPILVKDNIDVAGLPTTAGSISLADNVAAADAPIIANLRRNGALILGKTNLDQFATGLVGVRSPYGMPRNPFGVRLISGGSSSWSSSSRGQGRSSRSVSRSA